jgi:hypothetical protein
MADPNPFASQAAPLYPRNKGGSSRSDPGNQESSWPLGGTLDLSNHYVLPTELLPRQELTGDLSASVRTNVFGPAMPFRLAVGSLHIQQPLSLLKYYRLIANTINPCNLNSSSI